MYRDERFYRVQVKYRAAVNGQLTVELRSIWVDRNRVHIVPLDRSAIDLLCIYCPDTRACYYLDPHAMKKSATLRLEAPRNQQKKNIKWAEECRDIPSTVLGVLPGSRRGLEDEAIVGQSAFSIERP